MTTQTELKALTVLRSVELTHDLDTKHLKKLATMAREVEFAADEIIYRQGEIGKAIYLIESGEVVIEIDVPGQGYVTTLTVGPNQLFGWSALFPSERKQARARATKPTQVIAINVDQLRTAWQKDHELEYAIIRRASRVMADRIRATRQQLANLLTSDNRDR